MENTKVTRSWGVAVAIIAAVVCIAAAALTFTTVAKAQIGQAALPAVVVQWQPQSILETKFAARVNEDNAIIVKALNRLAGERSEKLEKEVMADLKRTYLKAPKIWKDGGWIEGFEPVFSKLKDIITRGSVPQITSVSIVIEYLATTGETDQHKDIDARAAVRVTFSASPGDNILEGTLKHSRVCEII